MYVGQSGNSIQLSHLYLNKNGLSDGILLQDTIVLTRKLVYMDWIIMKATFQLQ